MSGRWRARSFAGEREQGVVAEEPTPGYNNKIPESILTPDEVETRVGTLEFFDGIPTSFVLDDEQVDRLIAVGRELLRNNPDYQRFLAGLRSFFGGLPKR